MADSLPFKVRAGTSPNVVICDCGNIPPDGERFFLLRSDAHSDNPQSNLELQIKHLEEAKKRKAGVIDTGDLMCLMQGSWDPRKSKSKVRPEHNVDNYLDSVINWCADLYEPYAHLWVMQGMGNHEASILKRHETNVIERLASRLRDRTGAAFPVTGYTGWVLFQFKIGKTQTQSIRLWHTHGTGGGGVTKGLPQAARERSYVENADIMVSGHTHDQWATRDVRLRLNSMGTVERRSLLTLKIPTYKDEYQTGLGGWAVESGHAPKPTGGYFLRFYRGREKRKGRRDSTATIKFEVREAEV
tara:strand:- start:13307 stop:14209 length:903 start_codon:yes stop_codon:yes gene_type:complete